jgi:hypothetical protein
MHTVPKIRRCRDDKPLYSVALANIFGVLIPNITGYPRDCQIFGPVQFDAQLQLGRSRSRIKICNQSRGTAA